MGNIVSGATTVSAGPLEQYVQELAGMNNGKYEIKGNTRYAAPSARLRVHRLCRSDATVAPGNRLRLPPGSTKPSRQSMPKDP